MNKQKAIKALAALVQDFGTKALADNDTATKSFNFRRASVLARIQWDLEDNHPEAVKCAWQTAARMDTADREDVPTDIWEWMRAQAGN